MPEAQVIPIKPCPNCGRKNVERSKVRHVGIVMVCETCGEMWRATVTEADLPSTTELVRSLRGDFCPICGRTKKPSQTMCNKDYRRLTDRQQDDLYDRIGSGYEQAIVAVMNELAAHEFKLQPVTTQKQCEVRS